MILGSSGSVLIIASASALVRALTSVEVPAMFESLAPVFGLDVTSLEVSTLLMVVKVTQAFIPW